MPKNRSYALGASTTGVVFAVNNCAANAALSDPNTSSAPPAAGTVFASGGAQVLTNVHVQLIFWGAWWNNNPLGTQVTNAVANLLAGPYMSYLAQYGVRRGNVRGSTFVNDSEPGTFTYAAVGNFIINLLNSDRLPEPDDDWPIVYAVIMPANSSFAGDSRIETVPLPPGTVSQVDGANSSIVWNDYDIGDVDNDPAYYFWTGNDGTLNFITTVLSHELAEIATDPKGVNGIRQVGCAGGACQIGDACTGWCDFVRGVKAQAYWSQADANCVLPKVYSVRRTLAGKSIGGTIAGPIASLNAWLTGQF